MKQDNDGGPAFPSGELKFDDGDCKTAIHNGMSLRDWFAGQALVGLAADDDQPMELRKDETADEARRRVWSGVAKVAYIIADAMIAAREAKP